MHAGPGRSELRPDEKTCLEGVAWHLGWLLAAFSLHVQVPLGTLCTGEDVQASPAFSRDQARAPVLADVCISSMDLVCPDSGASFQRGAALRFPLIP